MLDIFKAKMAPEGPVEVETAIEIERPAHEVYAMIDFNDPRNYKAAVGTITKRGPKQFDMVLDLLPGMTFPITELEAEKDRLYTIESPLPKNVGRLEKTVERAEIEPLGENRCKVAVKTIATFAPMKLKYYADEVAMITMACQNSLTKLKVHAEQGVDAIREIEEMQKHG